MSIPTVGVPGDTSFGTLQQGYLETSNVDPVTEITIAMEVNYFQLNSAEYFTGIAPASTMVEVCKFTSPEYLIEMNAIAVLPNG